MRLALPLLFAIGCAGGSHSAESSAAVDVATPEIFFDANWLVRQSSTLYAGKPALLHYDAARLPSCRATYNGLPAWAISASYGTERWTFSADVTSGSASIIVPAGRDLAMWFENSDEHGCTAWDSDYGANFRFLITTLAAATLHFQRDWAVWSDNPIAAGQPLLVDYEIQRAPYCRGASWDVLAWWRFDGGAASSASAQHPLYLDVPAGAKRVELWFENRDASGCDAWDSDYGRNFNFAVN